MDILLTWAYDGSGVALRTPATIVASDDRVVYVTLTADDAQAAAAIGRTADLIAEARGIPATIPAYGATAYVASRNSVTKVGSPTPLASFNWLD